MAADPSGCCCAPELEAGAAVPVSTEEVSSPRGGFSSQPAASSQMLAAKTVRIRTRGLWHSTALGAWRLAPTRLGKKRPRASLIVLLRPRADGVSTWRQVEHVQIPAVTTLVTAGICTGTVSGPQMQYSSADVWGLEMLKLGRIERAGLGLAAAISLSALGCGEDAGPDAEAAGTTGSASTAASGSTTETVETEAGTGSGSSGEVIDEDAPTWYADVAPVVAEHCTGCHTEGGIAPYSFTDYESTAPLASALALAVESGSMPPWGAAVTDECTPPYGFKDDISLSTEEVELIRAWSDAGAPAGDPEFAAELPAPPDTQLDPVDTVLQMAEGVTIDGTRDQFLCFSLDPGVEIDRYFNGMQIVPGNDKVVHHVLVYLDETGESEELAGDDGVYECSGGAIGGTLLGAWAPGTVPMRTPEDVGMRVTAGSRIVLNIHYHPTGLGPEVDEGTRVELDWMDEQPTWRGEMTLVGNSNSPDELLPNDGDRDGGPEFRIPAGAQGHLEEMVFQIPEGIPQLRVWSVGSHMHYVGTDMQIRLQGDTYDDCMLHTPNYSFEWQRLYSFDTDLDQMPLAIGGDQIYLRCEYDNSMNNPFVVEALKEQGLDGPIDVVLGEETLDEMCLGVFGIAVPSVLD